MYELNTKTGIVTLTQTGRQVAPAQSFDDPNFLAYKSWIEAGGVIEIVESAANEQLIVVDKASFKIALARLGLLDTVLALVSNADIEIQILFNDKTEFHSNNKVLNEFAAQHDMAEQLQDVFALAQQIMQET